MKKVENYKLKKKVWKFWKYLKNEKKVIIKFGDIEIQKKVLPTWKAYFI